MLTPANIELYVSCHSSGVYVPRNSLLRPIQVGSALAGRRFAGMLHDDDGEGISTRNPSYCELTGQYWAWKHSAADYLGFLHYRRYFNFSSELYPVHHEPFIFGEVVFDRNDQQAFEKIAFEEKAMRSVIEAHDFVSPTPVATPDGANVYDQYRLSAGHHIEDLDCVLDLVERQYPEIWPSAQKYLSQDKLYVCNMFVMRRDLFQAYSSFLFDVLFQHERLCDSSHYTAVARRVSGYLGERLCGIYLTYLYDQGYNGIDLQRVYFRDTTAWAAAALPAPQQEASEVADVPKISFGPVTRGNGKIYAQLTLSALEDGGHGALTACSRTTDGHRVPAKVVHADKTDVLVLPVLAKDQVVTVEARRGEAVTCAGSRKFSATMTMLESRKNTLFHDKRACSIRNCDQVPLVNDVRVQVERIVEDVDQTDVIQGMIEIPLRPGGRADACCEVIALDSNGCQISVGDWVCMGDEIKSSCHYPAEHVRCVSFSLRIPRVGSFVVWVRFPSGEFQDGLACVEAHVASSMRDWWKSATTAAANCQGYDEWFRNAHRASEAELELQRRRSFGTGPLFSIIVPLYKTPLDFFGDVVRSVLDQTYENWELILINASPEDVALAAEVEATCAGDSRIRCIALSENLGITENTNEGIKAARGDFMCFLDHDDLIEPDALYWYADALATDDQIDLFYCDEDKLLDGCYVNPFFKPDWNPDLLLGMNYVCHFLAVRSSIVRDLELPTREYDGSQDYHMTFRVGERARHVCHIPRVLYHWRISETSTAKAPEQKDYALETSRHAVQTHLDRCGVRGTVEESPIAPRRFVVSYDLGSHPLVSIIIPNKDAIKVLNRCLVSLRRHTTYDNYEIVIVENNSEQPQTFDYYWRLEQEDSRISLSQSSREWTPLISRASSITALRMRRATTCFFSIMTRRSLPRTGLRRCSVRARART